MYLIYITLLVSIIALFWQTIFTVIKAYKSNSLNSKNIYIGNIWFISLLFINVIIIFFIYLFYKYKISDVGRLGIDGPQGFPGEDGEVCLIKSKCKNYE